MNKLIAVLIILLAAQLSVAQPAIKDYVTGNTAAIASIDPATSGFEDLTPIGNAIGDARIVMLGEQDHGDAPTFAAKIRLVIYLHKTKGFDVLAFESDLFSSTYGFEQLPDPRAGFPGYYKANIFPYWTICDAATPLFTKYFPESFATANPLILAGFDNQMYLRYSYQHLGKTMDSISRSIDLAIVHQESQYKELLATIELLSNQMLVLSKNRKYYEQAALSFQEFRNQLAKKLEPQSFWLLVADNLITSCNQIAYKDADFTKSCNYRDSQMAANLEWLCNNKYPGKKIIVWAANYHVSKYSGHFNKKSMNESMAMATVFAGDEKLRAQTYSIGFASYDGDAGRIGTTAFRIDKPENNGFENWIDKTVNYAFVDFRPFNIQQPGFNDEFPLKSSVSAQGVHKSHDALWNRMFDGIFFIRHMYPCKISY